MTARTSEQPYVTQGIQIDFHTELTNISVAKPFHDLVKISVALPANSPEL